MPLRKACPVIPARNGSQFPNGAPRGNCDPEFELETGCGFQIEALWETVPHLEGRDWGAVSGRDIKNKVAVE